MNRVESFMRRLMFQTPCLGIFLTLMATLMLAGCTSEEAEVFSESSQELKLAKNIIIFIGDGMGISTITAARIFDGQSRGESGEENMLSFESFPNVSLVKTYNTNQLVPDSAGTATAIHTGTKTRAGMINVGPQARRRNCEESLAHPLQTIGEIVQQKGKALGIVTTTRVTHATPATLYARVPERDWESDMFMSDKDMQMGCQDIARQLVSLSPEQAPDIVLGGGLREFQGSDLGGMRKSPSEDLIASWLQADTTRQFIRTREELTRLGGSGQVMGLFSQSHMTYIAKLPEESTEPSIQEMTAKAIDYLEAREEGYYLLVEGGRIDHGHHRGYAGYAMLETQAFAQAVSIALEKVDLEETLILVTADHSHVFTLSGYPTRGNPILGLVVGNNKSGEPRAGPTLAADGQPYTIVGYHNGPGAIQGIRPRPETGIYARTQSLIPLSRPQIDGTISDSETHGGEDVALYAIGPGSDRVRGVIEQNRIFGIMMDAFGWDNP